MVIMILYLEFVKHVISTMFHFLNVFNKKYASHVRQNILRISQDGLSDSVRQLIISHEPHDHLLLRMLLNAFQWSVCIFYYYFFTFVLKAIHIIIIINNHTTLTY